MEKSKDVKLLIILIILLLAINYPFLDRQLTNFLSTDEEVLVSRIIDGDTIEAENWNSSIRLLGINTPERGELFYEEARQFLESRILNKNVTLRFGRERYDKYDRTLAYVFLDRKNVNRELIENGFANYYFPSGRDSYYEDFLTAWKICIENNVNLCEKSGDICVECIELKNSETLINTCSFSCNLDGWKLKAEGRDNIILTDSAFNSGEEFEFNLNPTETGDTIFLWDDNGKLVFWERFGS